ncbi:MAG TPA: electron transfer flavoprotein subunit alpha/FixB family protein [Acidobacteriaceae bacterium]|nr:electron transfer flavoprotein subunit alpha/FixB family protein [Acidobacteriaceae bacterium]
MILIVAEYASGKLSKSTYEMATCARQLGKEGPVTALVLGAGIASIANEAALLADQVLVADNPALAQYDPELWSAAVAQIAKEGEAHTVLISGSKSGRAFSPRVAVRLDAPLLEDVISVKADGNKLSAERYTYLARVMEKIETDAPVVVVTVKQGAFSAATPGTNAVEQFDADVTLPQPRLRITGRSAAQSARVALSEADIVVAGGRGVGSAEGFTALVEGLADALGGAVGATRAIVDAGWRPYSEQVGQTGKTVQPKMYIAVGISGAVQHLSGMNKSQYIVAINKDADAPIFKVADYGIVGDVNQIVPAMIAALRK